MEKALEKRLNRQIKGRLHRFAAVVPPGFEESAQRELEAIGISEVEITASGLVSWNGKIESFWLAHATARLPVSIRWCIESFVASGFGELQRKTEALPWELYLAPGTPLSLSAAAQMSRLWHEGAIVERLAESLTRLGYSIAEEGVKILAHLERNRCTLWLQGERESLYQRGFEKKVAAAPLRDNLAWGLLQEAELQSCRRLCDPMSGSGSFSLEAALATQGQHPALLREFDFIDFEKWPSTRPAAWEQLKKRLPTHHPLAPTTLTIDCGDLSPESCTLIQENIAAAALPNPFEVKCADFFDLRPAPGQGESLLLLNPPWGKRIPEEILPFYREIGRKIERDFTGWRWMVIAPGEEAEAAFKGSNLRWKKKMLFRSGGLPLAALFGES